MHLNINSLLLKIDDLRQMTWLSNAAAIGNSKLKLGKCITILERRVDNYDVLRCDRNRNRGWISSYIRNDLRSTRNHLFSNDIQNLFFEIHLL